MSGGKDARDIQDLKLLVRRVDALEERVEDFMESLSAFGASMEPLANSVKILAERLNEMEGQQ